MALLNLQSTPAEMLLHVLGRQVATILPTWQADIGQEAEGLLEDRKEKAKQQYDQIARDNSYHHCTPGQDVHIQDRATKTWSPGTVVEKFPEPR